MALHVRIDVPPIPEALEALAEGLVRLNVVLFAFADHHGREAPLLYESGVTYKREPRGSEWWENSADVIGVAAQRTGDCEDLASYRAAELRYLYGEPARVRVIRNSRGMFHAVVQRGDGSVEDPSRILLNIEQSQRAQP